MRNKEIFKSKVLDKTITNFEITRDSILQIARDKFELETIDIECFLDELSEKTLEIILKDISKTRILEKENEVIWCLNVF